MKPSKLVRKGLKRLIKIARQKHSECGAFVRFLVLSEKGKCQKLTPSEHHELAILGREIKKAGGPL